MSFGKIKNNKEICELKTVIQSIENLTDSFMIDNPPSTLNFVKRLKMA